MYEELEHCYYCEETFNEVNFRTDDHIIARSKGGTNNIENRVPCCHRCNQLKRDLSLEEFAKKCTILSRPLAAANALKLIEAIKGHEKRMVDHTAHYNSKCSKAPCACHLACDMLGCIKDHNLFDEALEKYLLDKHKPHTQTSFNLVLTYFEYKDQPKVPFDLASKKLTALKVKRYYASLTNPIIYKKEPLRKL